MCRSVSDAMKPGRRPLLAVALGLAGIALFACGDKPATEELPPRPDLGDAELVLYTSLAHENVVAITDAWRESSGVTVSFLIDDASALIDKMANKEHYPGADLLLLSESVGISSAVDRDVLRPLPRSESSADGSALPVDADGYWRAVGITADLIVRAAAIDAPATYAELGDARYKGELCLRRGIDPRSVALVAGMADSLGARDAELAVRGWRYNLAAAAFDTEADLLQAIFAGDCAIGIVDSRSVAAIDAWPAGITASPPTDTAAGVHVHPLAIGVSRHARDPETAGRFIDWLGSPDGQAALEAAAAAPGVDAVPEAMRETLPYYLYEDAELLIERARYR